MNRFFSFFIFLFFISSNSPLFSQCLTAPSSISCSGGDGNVTAVANANINSERSYWYTGSGTSTTNINLNGGRLSICGNLTISNINLNSGYLYIQEGASLTINGGGTLNLNNGVQIINKGTLTINRPVKLQNNGNIIFNALPTSILNINLSDPSQSILEISLSNSYIINNGNIYVNTFKIDQNASEEAVCLGKDSYLNITNLVNKKARSFTSSGEGYAYISYTGEADLTGELTEAENLVACQGGNSNTIGSGNFGSAILLFNPAVCVFNGLPVEFSSFSGSIKNGKSLLEWVTLSESNNDYFVIEQSLDATQWDVIGQIPGAGNSNKTIHYSFSSPLVEQGVHYYRIKQVDYNGEFKYANSIIALIQESILSPVNVYPNPFKNEIHVEIAEKTLGYTLINGISQLSVQHGILAEGHNILNFDSAIPSGIYWLKLGNGTLIKLVKH